MVELVLLSQGDARCHWQRCVSMIEQNTSLRLLKAAVSPIAQRIDMGVVRVFSVGGHGLLCLSTREAAGLNTLFIDYVQLSHVLTLQECLPALHELARSAGFCHIACCPVGEARTRLYQQLGFVQLGHYWYLEVE